MKIQGIILLAASVFIAPLFLGLINRPKAFFGGRRGRPVLQAYYDVIKLVRKSAVYSTTTTFIFRAGPVVGLACTLLALSMIPMGGRRAIFSFTGDFIAVAYLFGLSRFFTVLAALDTGSSFEGMGGSREASFSVLAEPVLFLCFFALIRHSGGGSFSDFFAGGAKYSALASLLVAASLFMIMLSENSRMPIDDPNTHLELTMIHEVMVLDHGGPDLALITYGAALKLWAYGSLVVNAALQNIYHGSPYDMASYFAGMLALAVVVGLVESIMARIRLVRFPQYMAVAAAFAFFAIALSFTR